MRYLLDTDSCIFLVNGTRPALAARVLRHHPDDLGVSVITAAELRFGSEKSGRRLESIAAVDRLLSGLRTVPFDVAAVDAYARVRADLEGRGMPMGPLDTLIAAHALALGAAVVTGNVREFRRVKGLPVEDWTR